MSLKFPHGNIIDVFGSISSKYYRTGTLAGFSRIMPSKIPVAVPVGRPDCMNMEVEGGNLVMSEVRRFLQSLADGGLQI